MPRIRKSTSNRGTTNNRKRIQQKVRETRKKRAKAAKKNPQWKSKQAKDPGIPNDFPYKDRILAEVQQERRLVIEERQRRKEAKKALKTGIAHDETEPMEIDEDAEVKNFDGVASIAAKNLRNVKLTRMERKPAPVEAVVEDDEDDEPALFNRDLPNLKSVLDHADVVLQVLDCRDPLAFRSAKIEEISAKRTILVLNKIDLCPQEAVSAWVTQLRAEYPTVLFRSASAFVPAEVECSKLEKGKGKVPVDNGVGVDALLTLLGEAAREKKGDGPLAVVVVGFTNAGKSSVINSIARRAILPTYSSESNSKGPTTTILPQEVTVETEGKQIKFVDTPGVSWESEELTEENRARDILLRNKGRIDRVKEPMAPVTHIISRANNEDLMVHYSLPAFSPGDVDAFLPGLARSKQMVKRRGAVDMIAACRVLLRDWNTGALRWFTMPTTKASPGDDDQDKLVLDSLPLRRELRKRGGLLKLSTGEVDHRLPSFEQSYMVESDDEEEDENDDEGDDDEDMNSGDDEDEEMIDGEEPDDDQEEEDLPLPPVPLTGKQKRKRGKEAPLPASKKVAFAKKPSTSHKPSPAEKPTRKVANAPSTKSKSKPTPAAAASDATGTEAYDFGKFF